MNLIADVLSDLADCLFKLSMAKRIILIIVLLGLNIILLHLNKIII